MNNIFLIAIFFLAGILIGTEAVRKPDVLQEPTPNVLKSITNLIFAWRYIITIVVLFLVLLIGFYLLQYRNWLPKDVIQICTGFLIFITLFFTALNYEFTSSKARKDYESARNLMTYNTATEWFKSQLSKYQTESVKHEKIFIASKSLRTIDDLNTYINSVKNREYMESIKGILNHFECLALAASKELINKDFIIEFYRTIFRIYYVDYYEFIVSERIKAKSGTIYMEFTSFVEKVMPNIKAEIEAGKWTSIIVNHKL